MRNDLAGQIIGRVKRLLDGLLGTLVWKQLPALPFLGQRLFTRYSGWVDGLFSKLHLPLASALLPTRNSNLRPLPLSYAWFDRNWIDRRKRSRSFWRQSGSKEDEDIQSVTIPESFFTKDAEESVVDQFQLAESESAADIMLSAPMLTTSSARHAEPTQTEQLAKRIAFGLEMMTNKGSPTPWRTEFRQPEGLARHIALRLEVPTDEGSLTPWHTPFEVAGVPYYHLGLVTNNSLLLDKFEEIITGQRLNHLEDTFYSSSSVDLSPPSLHSVSGHYIGAALMPVPGKFSLAERAPTQTISPFVPSSEVSVNVDLEPSGALPIALRGQPASEARVASFSHLSQSPSMISNDIPTRKVSSGIQNLFDTPLMAGNAATTPVCYPEEIPLFRRNETLDMAGVAGQYFQRLTPQPPLDRTSESHQTSPWHWSAGHIPPSPTQEAASQEMSEPAKAFVSTIKNSPFGGHNRSLDVGLALAPIGRQRGNIPAATSSAVSAGREEALETAAETMLATDPEALASEVYNILKRRLLVEKERATSVVS